MKVRVGISGFGRVGRQILKIGLERTNLEFVAVNDITDAKTLAHLFKYDSVYRTFKGEIYAEGDYIIVNGKKIKVFAVKTPDEIPWSELGVDVVIEATGKFRSRGDVAKHIKGTVKKAIITAPGKGDPPDITIVMGVNEDKYNPLKHQVISNASCTTNAFAHMVKVLHENFRVLQGVMTTIHSYTNDQRILDQPHKDLRRARAAAVSIIPTTTGAAKAIELIFPELKGHLSAISIRVPSADVSIVDFACKVENSTSINEVNEAFRNVSVSPSLSKYIGYAEEPLVSVDFIGNSHSVIFDPMLTQVIDGNLIKTYGWYDNEWGYSVRVVDALEFIASRL